ncbi:MAG: hypothetical protein EOO88_21360 [Pedobacter sp.]|nr:MAG: hypothetical protein EOO88_21360 [Pedobacter sp.]
MSFYSDETEAGFARIRGNGQVVDVRMFQTMAAYSGVRPEIECVGCARTAIARIGSQRAWHFAHKPLSASESILQVDRAGCSRESYFHKAAKAILFDKISNALATGGSEPLHFSYYCPHCSGFHELTLPLEPQFALRLHLEKAYLSGRLRPDISLSYDGFKTPVLAIEVIVTHPPSIKARQQYFEHKIRNFGLWVENDEDLTRLFENGQYSLSPIWLEVLSGEEAQRLCPESAAHEDFQARLKRYSLITDQKFDSLVYGGCFGLQKPSVLSEKLTKGTGLYHSGCTICGGLGRVVVKTHEVLGSCYECFQARSYFVRSERHEVLGFDESFQKACPHCDAGDEKLDSVVRDYVRSKSAKTRLVSTKDAICKACNPNNEMSEP